MHLHFKCNDFTFYCLKSKNQHYLSSSVFLELPDASSEFESEPFCSWHTPMKIMWETATRSRLCLLKLTCAVTQMPPSGMHPPAEKSERNTEESECTRGFILFGCVNVFTFKHKREKLSNFFWVAKLKTLSVTKSFQWKNLHRRRWFRSVGTMLLTCVS